MVKDETLSLIKNFVDSSYNNHGSKILVVPHQGWLSPLSKIITFDNDLKQTVYYIKHCIVGDEKFDLRVLMHEYGHIYLGHFGKHFSMDKEMAEYINQFREGLVEKVRSTGMFKDPNAMIEKVADDKELNHLLHNLAMDLEVNSKILDLDDCNEMIRFIKESMEIRFNEAFKFNWKERPHIVERFRRSIGQSIIKYTHPHHLFDSYGEPFPEKKSYEEYLYLLLENLPSVLQKASELSREALPGGSEEGNGEGSDGEGSSGLTQDQIEDMLYKSGMSDNPPKSPQKRNQPKKQNGDQSGDGDGNNEAEKEESKVQTWVRDEEAEEVESQFADDEEAAKKAAGEWNEDWEDAPKKITKSDHYSRSREESDEIRETTTWTAGNSSRGSVGRDNVIREIRANIDPIELAIEDVMNKFSKKVYGRVYKGDLLYKYNRGIQKELLVNTFRPKVTVQLEPKIVFVIDVSGSMDTQLIDRVLGTIAKKMAKMYGGLKYDIISWNTSLCQHITDINPKKPITKISSGGCTDMADAIKYFKSKYDRSAIMVLISDFEDNLKAWHEVEKTMPGYSLYGFNYGSSKFNQKFTNLKVRNFSPNY